MERNVRKRQSMSFLNVGNGPEHNTWEPKEEFQTLAGSMWSWLLALGGVTLL